MRGRATCCVFALSSLCVSLAHAQTTPVIPIATALQADLGRASDAKDVTCADLKTPPTKWALLILGSEPDLGAAEAKARAIGRKSGVRFSSEGFSLSPKTKQPEYVRRYQGEYYPRTSECEGVQGSCITIEQSSAYTTLAPNLFVIVGDVGFELVPESLARFRKAVPDAFVKYSTVKGDTGGYGAASSCTEWDVIVLARTKRFDEADAIAKAVSQGTGIRYDAKSEQEVTAETWEAREAPYPVISVERASHYDELGESPFFLVVGGDLSAGEGASPKLLKRYKKLVPNAYRLKGAVPMCGA